MLKFFYGTMGCGKTAFLIDFLNKIRKDSNFKVLLTKPELEAREEKQIIKSRNGKIEKIDFIFSEEIIKNIIQKEKVDFILIDEAQFLTKQNVDFLAKIGYNYNIYIICFGLRTDFLLNLFEGSKRLLELADYIQEIPGYCWCGEKASCNARINNNEIVREGEQFLPGGNESYQALCLKHYNEGRIK